MSNPFRINMNRPKLAAKKKSSKVPQILMTIVAILIAFAVDCVLPGIWWWLIQLLNPTGFWQMVVTVIISFYTFIFECIVLFVSTAVLFSFLAEVVW